ncbi:tellurite resistance TerB family protein [Vibrio olivae]|uniref:Tellurite resistance TerB family protein n=1 Tax=Vibrio olivae TaxID=1243002 RepID=A0ABV5HL96_9VIBR
MDLKGLLNQALTSDIVRQGKQQLQTQTQNLKQNPNTLKTLGTGAAAGGLVELLMGSKKSKKMGKTALKVGGAAALGALAYKVYNDWQNKQPDGAPQETFDANDERHHIIIIKAMIAAAKADGHVDDNEMARIEEALQGFGADDSVRALIQEELNKALEPSTIARLAQSPQQGAEIYLASLMVADEQNFMEKAYLDELAKQLNLSTEVITQLQQQARQ